MYVHVHTRKVPLKAPVILITQLTLKTVNAVLNNENTLCITPTQLLFRNVSSELITVSDKQQS